MVEIGMCPAQPGSYPVSKSQKHVMLLEKKIENFKTSKKVKPE